jgi:glycosidase
MLDRFNNPSAPRIHAPFDDPAYSDYQGGKFSGVRDQLAYIKQLGVGDIWLSPVLRNLRFDPSYHGYGIRAEPRFADDPDAADDELRALVDAAHDHGLYVVRDIVLNHTGDVFAYQCDPWDAACTGSSGGVASYHDQPQPIRWRDQDGVAQPGFAVMRRSRVPRAMRSSGRRSCSRMGSSADRG